MLRKDTRLEFYLRDVCGFPVADPEMFYSLIKRLYSEVLRFIENVLFRVSIESWICWIDYYLRDFPIRKSVELSFFLYLFCTDKHAIDVFKQRIELLSLCDNPSTSWSLEWMEKQWMNRNCGSFVTQRYGKTVIIIYRMSVQSTWIHSENDLYWINQPLYPYYYHIVDMFLNENSIPLIHFYYYSSYIFFFHFIISLLFWYLSIFSMSLNVI